MNETKIDFNISAPETFIVIGFGDADLYLHFVLRFNFQIVGSGGIEKSHSCK